MFFPDVDTITKAVESYLSILNTKAREREKASIAARFLCDAMEERRAMYATLENEFDIEEAEERGLNALRLERTTFEAIIGQALDRAEFVLRQAEKV